MTAPFSEIVQDDPYKNPIPGVEVYVLNADGSNVALTNSGGSPINNPVVTDQFGAFSFYAPDGVYRGEYRYGGQTYRKDSLIVGNPAQYIGPAGPAANGRVNLAALKAAATTDLFSTYDGALWSWTTGDFTGKADDLNVVKANSTALTSGAWVRQTAAKVAMTPSGTGALTRTAAQVMDEVVYASGFSGYDETGATSSYAAIMAADVASRSRNRRLVIAGKPLIDQPMFLDAPVDWELQGGHFVPGELNGGSVFLKAASLQGPGIVLRPGAYGSKIVGGGMLGNAGNGGDCIQISANSVTLRNFTVQGAGRDGIRIGGYAPGDTYYTAVPGPRVPNANFFNLDHVMTGLNGRDGLSIDDQKGGAIDANAGFARVEALQNGRHGIYVDKSYLGSTLVGTLAEGNAGWGIYLAANALGLSLFGGDVEGNTTGNVYEAVARANRIFGLSVQGVLWNNMARSGAWTPAISGQTSAGAGTYTVQKGRYVINGNSLRYWGRLVWTAHTGTGSMIHNLPVTVAPIWDASTLGDVPVEARLANSSTVGVLKQATSTVSILAGDLSTQTAMATSGTLLISGEYEIVQAVDAL